MSNAQLAETNGLFSVCITALKILWHSLPVDIAMQNSIKCALRLLLEIGNLKTAASELTLLTKL